MIAACALVEAAAKTAAAASAVTATTTATETAPLLPTGTEAVITGAATTPAQITTRATTAVVASAPAVELSPVAVEVRISLTRPSPSLVSLLHLHHQEHHCI